VCRRLLAGRSIRLVRSRWGCSSRPGCRSHSVDMPAPTSSPPRAVGRCLSTPPRRAGRFPHHSRRWRGSKRGRPMDLTPLSTQDSTPPSTQDSTPLSTPEHSPADEHASIWTRFAAGVDGGTTVSYRARRMNPNRGGDRPHTPRRSSSRPNPAASLGQHSRRQPERSHRQPDRKQEESQRNSSHRSAGPRDSRRGQPSRHSLAPRSRLTAVRAGLQCRRARRNSHRLRPMGCIREPHTSQKPAGNAKSGRGRPEPASSDDRLTFRRSNDCWIETRSSTSCSTDYIGESNKKDKSNGRKEDTDDRCEYEDVR